MANAVNLNDSGIAAFNADTGTFFGRTLTSIDGSVSIINPDGIGGNPDFSVNTTAININDLSGILSVTKGGTGVGTLTQNSVLLGNGTNPITSVPVGTNGQLLIGATGAAPAFSTLEVLGGLTLTPGPNTLTLTAPGITITGSSGITVTGSPVNLGGTVTVAVTGGGINWITVTDPTTIIAATGYIANNGTNPVAFTLPATSAVGDIFYLTGSIGSAGWILKMGGPGQVVFFGNVNTEAGTGTLTTTNPTDSILAVCVTGGSTANWNVISSIGNMIIA